MAIYTSKFTQQEIDDGIDNANSALQPTALDNYYDKDAIEDFLDDKQDTLVSGTNIKTVNNKSLLGSGNVSITKSDVGLGNVTNDAQVKRSEMGVASGVATLDSAGKVPTSQLPSYVDDVLEYDTKSDFPTTGEAGKIYVDKSTNTSWRWSGTAYVQIKGDLAIGTTTGTAADGGVANTHYNNTSNPHSVTKAQVGLGSVVNTGDSATPVSGGTTKFTTGGAYTELNKKVDKVSGKGLSTNDYTTDEKNKLAGIATGAEVNVQSDWNATSGDAFIKNKPTIPDSFQWFGTSSTAAATVQKEVSIPSITSLKIGQIIVVQPTVTSTVADSTLKLNSFDAYPMRYNNAAITTSTDSVVWNANFPSLFVFDGSYWVFLGHGLDSNTTYSNRAAASGGTAVSLVTTGEKYIWDNPHKSTVSYSLSEEGWYRIASVSQGKAFDIIIDSVYTSGAPSSVHIVGNMGYTSSTSTNKSSITQIGGTNDPVGATSKQFTKARVVKKYNATGYIEVYYTKSSANTVEFKFLKCSSYYSNPTAGEVPDGYVVDVELDFGTVSSGIVLTHQDISGKADKTATVSDVIYDQSTGKLKKTVNGTTTNVCDVVTSGFRIIADNTTGYDTLTAFGSASITPNDSTGYDAFVY